MSEKDRIEKREITEDTYRADLTPYTVSNGDTGNDIGVRSGRGTPPSTPRWVKVFAIIAIVLVLLFVILQFTGSGDHGPSRHSSSGSEPDSYTSYSSIAEDTTPSGDDRDSHTPPSSIVEDRLSSGDERGGYTLPSNVTEHGVKQL